MTETKMPARETDDWRCPKCGRGWDTGSVDGYIGVDGNYYESCYDEHQGELLPEGKRQEPACALCKVALVKNYDRKPKSVLRHWVHELTLQMQGTLVCAIRGPDGVHKHDPCKPLVRALRAVILNNARRLGPNNSFAGDGSGVCEQREVDLFFESVDQYPHHWRAHFLHAAEVVGYMHPDKEIRDFWLRTYTMMVMDMHLHCESRQEMLHRLRGDGDGE
jgi:hypothetical protein